MQIAPPHPDEARRLEALRALEILDSPAEAAFDAIVAAAAAGCGTEIALISLVDEHRQWFKAAIGLGDVHETPRDHALCAHAILEDGMLEVPDASRDERFADNPLVTGFPRIRLYAGVPLRLSGGEAVGTLCVIGRQARALAPSQRTLLQHLATAASHALEAARALRTERRAAALLADTRDGVISLDAEGRIRYCNAAATVISSRPAEALIGQRLEDAGLQSQDLRRAVASTDASGRLSCETTLTQPDGQRVPVTITQTPHMSLQGRAEGWTLYLRDRRGELAAHQMARDIERLSLVAQRTSNAVIISDTRGRVTWVNEGFERITGYRLDEVRGRAPGHFLQCPETDPNEVRRLRKALDARQPFKGELLNRGKHGRKYWLAIEIQPMRERDGSLSGFMAIESDITERKEAALALHHERERLHQIMEGTAVATWRWNVETGETEFDERGAAMVGEALSDLSPTTVATWSQRVHPDDLSQAMVALERHLNGQTGMYEAEMRIRHRQGHWVWILARGRVSERSEDGRPVWIAGTQQDIHQSKLAQIERQTVSERFRLAAESAGIGVWEIQLPGTVTQWDDQMLRLHGASGHMDSDAIKAYWQQHVEPGDLQQARRRLAETFQTGCDYESEYRVRLPNGEQRILRNMARLLGDLQRSGEARLVGICQDITDLRRQEAQLRASRAFLDNAGRVAGLGGWSLDVETRTLEWSDQACRIHGVTPGHRPSIDEALAVFPSKEREQLAAAIRRCIVEGMPFDLELPMAPMGQMLRWIRIVGEAQREKGRTAQIIGAIQDVTGSIELREALQQRSAQLQAILQHLPCGLSVIDSQRDLTVWNEEFKRLMGFPEALFEAGVTRIDDFIQHNAHLGEYDANDTQAGLACGLQGLKDVMAGRTLERQRPDGTWVEIRSGPMPDGGRVITYMDISSRKRAQQEAETNERILREAIGALNEAFALYDPQDRLVFCNEKYREVYAHSVDIIKPGVRFEELIRHGAEHGQYPQAVGRVDEWVAERLALRNNNATDFVQPLKNGRILRIAERRTPDGYTVGFRIDITELVQAREAALSASHSKSQFLATMSHEIRTPMNAILGMLALLGQTPLSVRQADYATKAEGAARSLLGIINDVLDYSKIEAGKLELDPQPMRLHGLLDNLWAMLSVSIGDKPLTLVRDIDPALPRWVRGDELRLQQVLLNLCSNAVKFTPAGEVTLSIRTVKQDACRATLRMSVRDTGIGIAPEHQAHIFDGFSQAEASTARRFGGSGLGLAISRHLLRLMGSDIQLHSTPGHGSEFSFEITLELPDEATAQLATEAARAHPLAATQDRALAGLRILLAEDNPLNQQIAQELLAQQGAQVTLAVDGQQALAAFGSPARPALFDIVLMDMQMPVMDGLTAARELRRRMGELCPPIVAMTANAMSSDRHACLEAGMVEHVGKPFSIADLTEVICRVTGHQATLAPARAAPRPDSARARAIARLGGDEAFLDRMHARFSSDWPAIRQRISHSLKVADAQGLARELHSLKGAISTLGLDAAAEQAAALEDQCRQALQHAPTSLSAQLADGTQAVLQMLDNHLKTGVSGPAAHEAQTLTAQGASAPCPQAWQAQLERLHALLISHDMQVLDVADELAPSAQHVSGLEELLNVIEAMDFDRAARLCDGLLSRIKT